MNIVGDLIDTLPINKSRKTDPKDLELLQNIFRPIVSNNISSFKLTFTAGMVFLLFHLPLIPVVLNKFTGNALITYIFLWMMFMLVFFIIYKTMFQK